MLYLMWRCIKRVVQVVIYILGVIFFIILCAGAYLWFFDPFELRPMFEVLRGNATEITTEVVHGVEERATEDKHPSLNATQERALEVVGINPANVPTTISEEDTQCFIEALGAERVAEIQAGATPSATEIFKARACIE